MDPQPNLPTIVPSVALLINLSPASEMAQNAEKSQVLVSQLGNLGLSATWVIDEARQVNRLGHGQLATTAQEVALTANERTPQRLRSELSNRQAAVQATSGHVVSVIAGDPQQLRARAALLADLGIRAVVSQSHAAAVAKPPRLVPCGLWQLEASVTLPQRRHRWSLLPTRRLTIARLLSMNPVRQPITVAIDPGQLSGRDLHRCQQLLQDIAAAKNQQLLKVATVSEVVAQLASQHEIKPQRSILRMAA